MDIKKARSSIPSVLAGLFLFILLAFFFGGKGHKVLASLVVCCSIILVWWYKTQQQLANEETRTDIANGKDYSMKDDPIVSGPIVPESFDINFIESEIYKIQNNPSLMKSYFQALKAEFHIANQISLINCLESYNRAVASGVDSQTEVLRKRKEYLYAKKDLLSVEDDLEIQQLEKELTKIDLQLKIETKKQQREDIKKQRKEPEDYDL